MCLVQSKILHELCCAVYFFICSGNLTLQALEKATRAAAKEGRTLDGSGRLPSAQVNKLLGRYPQPPHTIRLK